MLSSKVFAYKSQKVYGGGVGEVVKASFGQAEHYETEFAIDWFKLQPEIFIWWPSIY